jgi:hypothetical protein
MHLIAVSLDCRWGIDSPPLPLVLMQSALCSFSVPPAHRNWLIAVLSCFSYLGGKLSVDPTKLIIGNNCALIIFEWPTSVRHRCFQELFPGTLTRLAAIKCMWIQRMQEENQGVFSIALQNADIKIAPG